MARPRDRRHPGRPTRAAGQRRRRRRVLNVADAPGGGAARRHHARRSPRARRCGPCRTRVGVLRALPRTQGRPARPAGHDLRRRHDAPRSRSGGDRLAWRVTYRESSTAVWDVFVDADSGQVLKRVNMVKSASGLVWENYPGAALRRHGGAVDLDPWLTSTTQLLGPYVHAFSDLDDDDAVGAGEEVVPGVATRSRRRRHRAARRRSRARGRGAGATWTTNRQQNAVQAFYSRQPLPRSPRGAPIGFRRRFRDDDPVLRADRRRRRDRPGPRAHQQREHVHAAGRHVAGDADVPVARPELPGDQRRRRRLDPLPRVHARALEPADPRRGRRGRAQHRQAGAMGEGWSDWYAKDFLVAQFPALDDPARRRRRPHGHLHRRDARTRSAARGSTAR